MPMTFLRRRIATTRLLLGFAPLLAASAVSAAPVQQADKPPAAAVVSAHPLATEAGVQVLRNGGNAFDAAVAVASTLAVVEPHGSGIGGGGFLLLHRASDGKQIMLDGRETAPSAATATMYQDAVGKVIRRWATEGALAAGIPGLPAALAHMNDKYGSQPLANNLQTAIAHAEQGFVISPLLAKRLDGRNALLSRFRSSRDIFLKHGYGNKAGRILRQPDLGATLRALAEHGRDGFYTGPVAAQLVAAVRAEGGIWTHEDLKRYQIRERVPVRGQYQQAEIVSAAPPSSGGVVLMQTLNILSGWEFSQQPEALRLHLLTEAMRRSYRDRAAYLGDPDFVQMPLHKLLSPWYADSLRASIALNQATASSSLPPVAVQTGGGRDTTHFSILDTDGNRVSATLSINFSFGSGLVAQGTGVLLNNEMDDFSSKPGTPNGYGLVGSWANAIAPGKRMLSSMTPTFVEANNRLCVLGTPGGSRIISMVLVGTLECLNGASAQAMVDTPRVHHQYLPDALFHEPGAISTDVLTQLKNMGHKTKASSRRYGNMQAIVWDYGTNTVSVGADSRGEGLGQVFELP